MKKLYGVALMGAVALVVVWMLGTRYAHTSTAHDPGEEDTSVALGSGKVTIHYGTPKLAGRNLDEMIKPGLHGSWV